MRKEKYIVPFMSVVGMDVINGLLSSSQFGVNDDKTTNQQFSRKTDDDFFDD